MTSKYLISGTLAATLFASAAAQATTIDWMTVTSYATANDSSGSAVGTAGLVTFSYSGETEFVGDGSIYFPASSFTGGDVGNAPTSVNSYIGLLGGFPVTDTLTFSAPVTDPVVAIFSLGDTSTSASFVFTSGEPFTIVAGGTGPYFGQAITAAGNTVNGQEGNGVVQFNGTFTQISWTNPTQENFYGFTVGVPAGGGGGGAVPEPAAWAMMLCGFGGIGALARRRGVLGRIIT